MKLGYNKHPCEPHFLIDIYVTTEVSIKSYVWWPRNAKHKIKNKKKTQHIVYFFFNKYVKLVLIILHTKPQIQSLAVIQTFCCCM